MNVNWIGDWAIVGMGAIVSDWARVGEWAIVAEGAVVRQGMEVPGRRIAAGVPARVIEKGVDEAFVAEWTDYKGIYVDLARRYPEGLGPPSA